VDFTELRQYPSSLVKKTHESSLFLRRHYELILRFHQVLDECSKVLIGNLQPSMDRIHISPAIDAGSTSRRADLINEVALEFPDIESREPSIYPGIGCHIDRKRIND
jgi:hypothetical protein